MGPNLGSKPTLAEVLNQRLGTYTLWRGAALFACLGVFVACSTLYVQDRHQSALLHSIRQNITALSQNIDYWEAERVLSSFLQAVPGGSVDLVRDGVNQVSLPNLQRSQLPYQPPRLFSVGGLSFGSDGKLYSTVELEDAVSHSHFGTLVLATPLKGPLLNALYLILAAFALVVALLTLWRKLIRSTLSEALSPMGSLERDLEGVGRGQAPMAKPSDFEIRELAQVSQVICKQHEDVTRLTQLAAKAEGERRAKEGVRSLMHDLLNPYTAISTLIQTTILFPTSDEIRQELKAKWPGLHQQILSLLKAARHSELESLQLQKTSLLQTVKQGAQMGAVNRPSALILIDSDDEDPWILPHDRELLARAVANLVRNAVEENAERVQVWCERSPISIHIADNGPGIPDDKVCQLFEGRMASQKPNGSGIGFPTALRLVQLHGGRVLLEPAKRGAHFRIDLPELEAAQL